MPVETRLQERIQKDQETLGNIEKFKEFLPLFRRVMDAVSRLEERFNALANKTERRFDEIANGIKTNSDETLTHLKKNTSEGFMGEDFKRLKAELISKAELHKMELEQGNGDIRNELMIMMPKMPKPYTLPQRIPNDIEFLKAEIKRLEEELKTLGERRLGGGGTSAIGVMSALNYAIKRETPSGAINGSNTAYTVTKQISAVLSLAINGMVIHDNEYTVSGQTITFTTALPAGLSGTTFRVVYV